MGYLRSMAEIVLGWSSRMFYRPLVLLWGPLTVIFPFFTMLTLHFVNIKAQSPSQSWPMKIRDPVFRVSWN